MDISQRGLDLIKDFEGLELEAYQDIVGIWTIGYGHTSMAGPPEVVPGMEISEAEAERILRRDLGQYENAVEKAVKVDITQNMFDALTSITYNIGINGMKGSTFIKRLNNKDYEGAAEAMKWWNKAGGEVVAGLKRRRNAEAALFLDGFEEVDERAVAEVRGQTVEENSPRRGSLTSSRTMGGATTAGGAGALGAGAVVFDNMKKSGDGEGDEGSADQDTIAEGSANGGGETGTATGADDGHDGEAADTIDIPGVTEDGEIANPLEDANLEKAEEVFVSVFDSKDEVTDAIIVAAGVLAVLAAIYVMIARFDDWRNHKR